MVGQQNADIADTLQLRDVAIATIFWLSMYGCTLAAAPPRHLVNTTEPSVCGGDAALCRITLTTCYYYIPFNRNPVSRTLSAVDVSVLNADEVAALWRPLASETVSPLGRLPVERVTADCRLRAALSVDQRPHRRTRGAICRTSLST